MSDWMIEQQREHYRKAAAQRFDSVPCAVCGADHSPLDMRVVPHVGRTPRPGRYPAFFPEIEFQCPKHRRIGRDTETEYASD